ncbi:two-component sensor histidine kinase [Rhodocytophaga rosea]|uniref:histidine kinase n=1 Tax=Rhodocytophaga rosea TaxID=2704465 RepID=A0A6C0GEZ9_9BACT|nr:ATP-binding protein [Rhodocytophaga rosea]QHT66589.1 two-component sensor histidine kinase [Rhodocytophaga rosea]
MLFSPKGIAFVLAGSIALITTAFLSLVKDTPGTALFVAFSIAFAASFLLFYFSLEFLVFREINKIFILIDKVKKKDFKLPRKQIVIDTNPLRRLNEEIFTYATKKQQEIDELKKLENFRKEFLANVSHELKTPIFAAQGFIHTLIDGAVDDKNVRDKFLDKAARSLDGLDALVQDLLTLSQMETGDIKMRYEKFDIRQLTAEVFEQLEEKADAKRIRLRFNKGNQGTVWAYADVQRIGQVMTNLIDNAIKYGREDGRVLVSFDSEKDHLLVAVKDDGPGIEPEHLKRIFERFYRIEKSRSKDKGGTGLGLAIVKHIIEAHRSKVSVTSKMGKGTTFIFKLDKGEGKN